jgi:hypothetical protein
MEHFRFYATPGIEQSVYPGDSIDPFKAAPQVRGTLYDGDFRGNHR